MTISAVAGTGRSTVSPRTTWIGAPLIAPATSYSDTRRGTPVLAQKGIAGSSPMATAIGIRWPASRYLRNCWPMCWRPGRK